MCVCVCVFKLPIYGLGRQTGSSSRRSVGLSGGVCPLLSSLHVCVCVCVCVQLVDARLCVYVCYGWFLILFVCLKYNVVIVVVVVIVVSFPLLLLLLHLLT